MWNNTQISSHWSQFWFQVFLDLSTENFPQVFPLWFCFSQKGLLYFTLVTVTLITHCELNIDKVENLKLRRVLFLFLSYPQMSVCSGITFWKSYFSTIEILLHLCLNSVKHICLGVFLSSLYCSTDLYFYP